MFRPTMFLKGAGGWASKHLPQILSGAAFGLGIVTAVCAGKGALEANKRIAEYEARIESTDLTTQEKVKISLPCYVPAIIAGLGMGVCIFFANKITLGQLATAAAATATAERALADNREAIREIFNKKGLQKVDTYINEKRVAQFVGMDDRIHESGHGSTLCCESWLTGLKFHASPEWIHKCENDFNFLLNNGGDPCMNDFIQMLLPLLDVKELPEIGENLRMPIDKLTKKPMLMVVQLDPVLNDNEQVILTFTQRNPPVSRAEYDW